MCGIYGTTIHYDKCTIEKKMKIFRFRGPDCTGIKDYSTSLGEFVFGHNRLSVLDLDARSNQPFDYSDKISIVFNGEIYNYQELKKQYLPDVKWRTTSDTEVVGAMYEKFGTDCVHYFNGGFSFVIYDHDKQILFGARDRLGKKPFYYHFSERGFEFASQLFPLCIGNNYTINTEARQYYFTLQYIPDPISIINEVSKLKAGEKFLYNLKTKQLNIEKYWDIYDNSCNFIQPQSYAEALEVVDDLLRDAVEKRLLADVSVGVFLSGGIDSSLIAAYASKLTSSKTEAFSVGFEEAKYDESFYSKSVAEKLGIKYNHILCSSKEAVDVIAGLQQFYDEPMGDASAIPTSLLAQKAKPYITVALGGDGGDEVFWGYTRYLRYSGKQWIYNIPQSVRNKMAYITDKLNKPRHSLSLRMDNVEQLYLNRRKYCEAELFDALKVQQSMSDCQYLFGRKSVEKAFSDFDMKTLMNYAYNTKVDRATMRSSLELRTPMLDYRLVEYSRLLPLDYLYKKDVGQKRILRDLLYQDFPKELFERPKRGFGVPIDHWFRNELKELVLDTVNEKTLISISEYDTHKMLTLRDKHISGQSDYTTLLWLQMNYFMWLNLFESLNKEN